MRSPKYAKSLQAQAAEPFVTAGRGPLGFSELRRATLFHACTRALALASELETLQPRAVFDAINHLWRLSEALQTVVLADRTSAVDEKRAARLTKKALEGWNAYIESLPQSLAEDAEMAKYEREMARKIAKTALANAGPTRLSRDQVAKNEGRLPSKKAAPSKSVAAKKKAAKAS